MKHRRHAGSDEASDRSSRWLARIYDEFRQICYTRQLKLPKPHIALMSASTILGKWDPVQQTLFLADTLIRDHPWLVVVEVFKHELAHYLVDLSPQVDSGPHGAAFLRACDRLGVESWARHAQIDMNERLDIESLYRLDDAGTRMQQKIAKLLQLSHSSNEHEAALAMQKARQLQQRYQVEAGHEKAGFLSLLVPLGKKRVDMRINRICALLCRYYFVDIVHLHYFDASQCEDYKGFEIIGTPSHVLMAEYVLIFLQRQLESLWRDFQREKGASGLRAKKSYQLGILHGFERFLRDDAGAAKGQVPSTALSREHGLQAVNQSLTAYHHALKDHVGQRFPRLRTQSAGSTRLLSGAFAAGTLAGESLRVRQPLSGGHGSISGYLA